MRIQLVPTAWEINGDGAPFIGTEVLGAGYENRTRAYCLGSSRPTTKLILQGLQEA